MIFFSNTGYWGGIWTIIGKSKKNVGISECVYSTLVNIYKMDYHEKNQLSSFKIVNLVACQSLGLPTRIFNINGKSQRSELQKTAKI